MTISPRDRTYIIWQNRATRFYLAARDLYLRGLFAPAAYCAHLAVELIMKATLHYWDRSFRPLDARHNLRKMARMIANKARPQVPIPLPAYFTHEQRFLMTTRYPVHGQGVLVPGSLIEDLDRLFVEHVRLVPFQFNSELRGVLRGTPATSLTILRRHNAMIRRLRLFLQSH
jgi:HEPN domain-containing protein